MSAPHADQIINGYLARLEQALGDLPAPRRAELLGDVRSHIAEARAGLTAETDADLLNLLDRLGDPADLATEARDRLGAAPTPATLPISLLEIAAIVALVLVWPAGIALVWMSSAWSQRDKLLATVLFPAAIFGLTFFPLPVIGIGRHFAIVALVLLLTPAVWSVGAIYLAVRLYQTRHATPGILAGAGSGPGFLEVAAVVLTPLLWPIGVILLWTSSAWSTRDKLIGTLLPPGGYMGTPLLFFLGLGTVASTTTCSSGGDGPPTCTYSGPPAWVPPTLSILLVVFMILPIATAIYLAFQLRRANRLRHMLPA